MEKAYSSENLDIIVEISDMVDRVLRKIRTAGESGIFTRQDCYAASQVLMAEIKESLIDELLSQREVLSYLKLKRHFYCQILTENKPECDGCCGNA